MKILSPDAVRSVKRTLEVEASERISKLRTEEAKACKSFATFKKEIEEKKEAMLEDYRLSMESLSKQRNALVSEVSSLEKRKKAAEVPVDLKVKELSSLKEQASEDLRKAEIVKKEGIEAQERAESLLERLTDVKDALSIKEYDLLTRQGKLDKEEERLRRSNDELSRKWLEYHKKVTDMNADFVRRKFEIEALAKANDSYKESLDAVATQHVKDRRAIRDGYESLAKAREEILGRKT